MKQTWIITISLVVALLAAGAVHYGSRKSFISPIIIESGQCPAGWAQTEYAPPDVPQERLNCLTCSSLWHAVACIPPEAAK